MYRFKRFWILVGFLIVSSILVGGFSLAQGNSRITFATSEAQNKLDPHVTVKNVEMRLTYLLYDGLVTFGKDPAKVYPQLATSWETSEDGLIWTFNLRDDVYFEDGTHFDCSVVKFSFKRLLGIGKGPSAPFKVIKKVQCPQSYVAKFVLKKPFAPFIWTLASNMARIVPPSVMEHEEDEDWGQKWLTDHSLGSGPFRLKSWQKGQRIVLEGKKDYWGGAPKLDEVIVRTIKEPATLKMELLKGNIDIAEGVLVEDLQDLIAAEGVKVFNAPQFHMVYLYLDTQQEPFNNLLVRKAIAYAIDYPAIVKGIMKGWAERMEGPWYLGMWNKTQKLPLYKRNLPLARKLLAEAGYADGFTTTFTLAPLGNWPQIATVIQSNLADIGIKVKLEQYSWPTYVDKALGHEVELGILGITPDYPDPDDIAWIMYHSTSALNTAFYKSEAIDHLLEEGRTTVDQAERAKIYQEIQLFQHELVPYIYLFQDKFRLPMRSWVKGYHFNPNMGPLIPFQDMWVEK